MKESKKIQVTVIGYLGNEPSEWIKCTFKDYYGNSWDITIKDCDISGSWERQEVQFPVIGYLHGHVINQIKENRETIFEFDADISGSRKLNGEIISETVFMISEKNILS
ncbi:hypothetical protein VB796_22265 [Arcicella sp. LKC2W]|nr:MULTISPECIES: hypothetical protein [Arcicella]MEA5461811.1 hypothetical protein [Arcicella sp. LKC2W]